MRRPLPPQVYDWLTALGVEFRLLRPSPENSVPRFHFVEGTSINLVVPMLRAAMGNSAITFAFNEKMTGLIQDQSRVSGVVVKNLRTEARRRLESRSVILATGGFHGDVDCVREHWNGSPLPATLFVGGSRFALGTGHDAALEVGAGMRELDKQVIFLDAVPTPGEPGRALKLVTRGGVWVNSNGQRFVVERATDKARLEATLAQPDAAYWWISDQAGRARASIRDVVWPKRAAVEREIFSDPALVKRADSLEGLARAAGLPADNLRKAAAGGLGEPPFYAIRLYLMTRKNMGGVWVDEEMRVLDRSAEPVAGLYAAGEVTGFAGINGSHGMSGTFLGPAVFMGRVAGRSAARALTVKSQAVAPVTSVSPPTVAGMNSATLKQLIGASRPDYWHFETAHRLVVERGQDCMGCHAAAEGPSRPDWQSQKLATCTICH